MCIRDSNNSAEHPPPTAEPKEDKVEGSDDKASGDEKEEQKEEVDLITTGEEQGGEEQAQDGCGEEVAAQSEPEDAGDTTLNHEDGVQEENQTQHQSDGATTYDTSVLSEGEEEVVVGEKEETRNVRLKTGPKWD